MSLLDTQMMEFDNKHFLPLTDGLVCASVFATLNKVITLNVKCINIY